MRHTPPDGWLDVEIPLPFDPPPSRGEMAPEGAGGREELTGSAMRGHEGTGGDPLLAPSSHGHGDLPIVQGTATQTGGPVSRRGHGRLTACLSSSRDDWGTPPAFYHALDQEFHFLADLAASPTNTCHDHWIGPRHPNPARRDALTLDWWRLPEALRGGYLWLNPPYGRDVARWLQKCDMTAQQGVGVVVLLPARTDTKWFHAYCVGPEIRFIEGRLRVVGAEAGAPFPSMVVIFRPQGEGGLRGVSASSWRLGGGDGRGDREKGLGHTVGDAPIVPAQ